MTKKPAEPDEMRMPADKFDEMMRHALSAPPPSEQSKLKANPKLAPKAKTAKRDGRDEA